ncbi:toprim domain-containing protein [Nocardia gipuzkoensis]
MSAPPRTREQGSWETITTALEHAVGPGRPSGAWTKYCCPVHEGDGRGHKPSLGVKYDSNQQRTVVRCFAGCDNEAVLDVLGLQVRDMFDQRIERSNRRDRRANRPRPRQLSRADRAIDAAGLPLQQPKRPDLGPQTSPWKQVASYPYVRADGTIAGEVVRQEAAFERGRDKQFHQRHWNPQTGRMDAGGFEPLPYQLPQVLETIAAGGVVYIVEGEKDVAAAESAGLTATTNAGGAMVWNAEHAKWLKGARTVVIVADRDTAGYRRAERVMATLSGLVERVRVVQAATGKDLHDHLQCGHEIGELEPVAHLDPFTPGRAAAPAPATPTPAAETETVSAASSVDPATPGGTMAEYLLAPSTDAPAPHSDEVEHMSAQWSVFMRLLMNHILDMARKHAEQRRRYAEKVAQDEEDARIAAEQQLALDRAAVEARIRKVQEAGLEGASRTELAELLGDAVAWAEDSEVATLALQEVTNHLYLRYGIIIDPETGQAYTDGPMDAVLAGGKAPSPVADALAAAEQQRAAVARLKTAQDRMVAAVAAQQSLDESEKEVLYAEIEAWRANPTAKQLDQLSKKLAEKKVDEATVTRIRFVAAYLGTPGQTVSADEAQTGAVRAVSPTTELRHLREALVDPGEVVKPRVDQLLEKYQDWLRTGRDTSQVQTQLGEAVAVMTPEDQQIARERGVQIRKDPAGLYKRLWPQHVDRDELATTLRVYAVLAPQAERAAGKAGDLDDPGAAGLRKQAAKHRKVIDDAVTNGKGLHQFERDQIAAVMRDVEAGKTDLPELVFADEQSAAVVDADRARRYAQNAARYERHRLEEHLSSNLEPAGTVRRTRDDVTKVMDGLHELAAGRATLGDYERLGLDRELDAKLTAVGVSEQTRNRIRKQLDKAAGEAATMGKHANQVADRWAERMEVVAIERDPAKTKPAAAGYDSPERRESFEQTLRAQGLNDDQVAQRMAADSGHAKPPSAAVRGTGQGRRRSTQQGMGVRRTHHRRNGRGPEQGLGR